MPEIYKAIGLMSGTSMDGIDAAIIETDGKDIARCRNYESITIPYDIDIKHKIKTSIQLGNSVGDLEEHLTKLHAQAVRSLLQKNKLSNDEIKVIGFHGQTLIHQPERKFTYQIGDGKLLAELTKIDVVNDFRSNDIKMGGQGAPLVPIFHRAIAIKLPKPIAIVNIGGVANVTWLGDNDEMLAFDTGAGNALIDDLVFKHTGKHYDNGGEIAERGKVDYNVLDILMKLSFFSKKPPKSLDRNEFASYVNQNIANMKLEDAAATLVAFTVSGIIRAEDYFPSKVKEFIITGGGRHNFNLMSQLRSLSRREVITIDSMGFDGDSLEAQAFAYLAVRSIKGLPISFPTTTGVLAPVIGGKLNYYK